MYKKRTFSEKIPRRWAIMDPKIPEEHRSGPGAGEPPGARQGPLGVGPYAAARRIRAVKASGKARPTKRRRPGENVVGTLGATKVRLTPPRDHRKGGKRCAECVAH